MKIYANGLLAGKVALVNNAGITRDGSLRTMTVASNMSSLSGKSGNPGQTNYSAAKAGVVGL